MINSSSYNHISEFDAPEVSAAVFKNCTLFQDVLLTSENVFEET